MGSRLFQNSFDFYCAMNITAIIECIIPDSRVSRIIHSIFCNVIHEQRSRTKYHRYSSIQKNSFDLSSIRKALLIVSGYPLQIERKFRIHEYPE